MIESIKITSLNDIGLNLSYTSIFPVVNMSGSPVTDKANLQIIGNYILSQAGGANFVQAAQATLAQSITNAAQPNITSVGTLTSLTLSGNLNINVNDLKVSGGVNGYVLQTDGAGNLTWTAQTGGGGNGSPGGANTQIQFNDAGLFGGDSGLTYDKTTDTLTSVNINAGNVDLTGNINANWVIGDYVSGNAHNLFFIPGANINGQVPNSLVSSTVYTAAQPNITSVGTLSNLAVTGNVIAGNVYANSGTIGAQTLKGEGGNISNIQGGNVSGTVANANLTQYINIDEASNNYSYHIVLSAGHGDKDLHIDGSDNLQYNPNSGLLTATRVDAGNFVGNIFYSYGYPVANVDGIGNIATINLNGNGSQVLYGNGVWAAAGTTLPLANGNTSFDISSAGGNATITTNSNNVWKFTSDGLLVFPEGHLIIDSVYNYFGTDTTVIQTSPDVPLLSLTTGANSSLSTVWLSNTSDIANSRIAALYANPSNDSGIVRISAGNLATTTYNWDFHPNGNLNLPSNTLAINYANGTAAFGNMVQWTSVPVANTSAGTAGQAAYDSGGNLYVCVATNTWAKFAGTTSW